MNSRQETIRVRVRPQRIGVLVPWNASASELRQAIRMLTLVWGGRFCPIIPFGLTGPEREMTEKWLERMSPDFVYTIGIDDKAAEEVCMRVCRPFFCKASTGEPEKDLWRVEGCEPISAAATVESILAMNPSMDKSRIHVVWQSANDRLGLALAAKTGLLHRDRAKWFVEKTKGEFVEEPEPITIESYLHQTTAPGRLDLIDAGSHGITAEILDSRRIGCPTIIVMAELSPAMPLYWNLRMMVLPGRAKLLLLPAEFVDDPQALSVVTEWGRNSRRGADHCQVLCFPDAREHAQRLAHRLRPRLAPHGVKHVDIGCGFHPGSCVAMKTETETVTVSVSGRKVTVPNVPPRIAEFTRRRAYWMMDLAYETDRKRTPWGQLPPPPARIPFDVLNSPTPPSWKYSMIDDRRYGIDGISLRFREQDANRTFVLPSPAEMFVEIMLSHGIKSVKAEKRAPYEAVIALLGDLGDCAPSFRYPFRALLRTMQRIGPAHRNKLQGEARIDKARIRELQSSSNKDVPTRQRIGDARFADWRDTVHPRQHEYLKAFEFWTKKGLCRRVFQIPECPNCGQVHWVPVIDLTTKLLCPSCGVELAVPDQFRTGVELAPVAKKALDQGIMPVVLTARLLENMTFRSFAWFPSFKGRRSDGSEFEIDIIAVCDGVTVLCECKDLEWATGNENRRGGAVRERWGEAVRELRTLVDLAPACNARLVILSALVDEFPRSIHRLAKKLETPDLRIHLFTRAELEEGICKGGDGRFIWIENLLPKRREPVEWRKAKGERKIDLF